MYRTMGALVAEILGFPGNILRSYLYTISGEFVHGFPPNILRCTALVSASVESRTFLAESFWLCNESRKFK